VFDRYIKTYIVYDKHNRILEAIKKNCEPKKLAIPTMDSSPHFYIHNDSAHSPHVNPKFKRITAFITLLVTEG
jgi:hypothetical protein